MLSYYLIWHLKQGLKPLFAEDGVGRSKKYTLASVIERLKLIRKEKISFQGIISFSITKPDEEQKKILDMLGRFPIIKNLAIHLKLINKL